MTGARLRWIKFWPQDWHGSKELRTCSLAARGLWIDMLCIAHDGDPYGHVTINGRAATVRQIAEFSGISVKRARGLIAELDDAGIIARTADGTPYSRQMVNDGPRTDAERPPWSEWAITRSIVFRRDNHQCRYCGCTAGPMECDHVVPLAKGGNCDLDNLATACRRCNRSKKDKLLGEWGGYNG